MVDVPSEDQIARCLLPELNVRVVAVISTLATREAARRHGVVGGVTAALGRATTAGLLLATLTKDDERVTIQLNGNGPLAGIAVDASSSGTVRAFVKRPAISIPAFAGAHVTIGRYLGTEGLVRVARDVGLSTPFSGQTPFIDGEIDTDLENYLNTSEQIDSALGCETLLADDLDVAASAGLLMQALPDTSGAGLLARTRESLRQGALTRAILHGLWEGPADLAKAVLGNDGAHLQVLDLRPVHFYCPCSRERAERSLAMLGASDLRQLAIDPGEATVTCDFCREIYQFDAADLQAVAAQLAEESSPRRPADA